MWFWVRLSKNGGVEKNEYMTLCKVMREREVCTGEEERRRGNYLEEWV